MYPSRCFGTFQIFGPTTARPLARAPTQEGNTPLHYACLSDSPELILFLLKKAAATASRLAPQFSSGYENPRHKLAKTMLLEARNTASETPLLRAAVGGSVAVVQALLVRPRTKKMAWRL